MNQKSLKWGIGITLVWLIIINLFWFFGDLNSPESLNELGDALAGIFAPVAFLWLVLGYVQQGKQLEQNTKALEQQETALQLQIDEMKESVKQQTLLTKLQTEQFEAINFSIKPILELDDFKYIEIPEIIEIPRGDFVEKFRRSERIEFYIRNTGSGSAHNVLIRRSDEPENNYYSVIKIDKNQSHKVKFDISKSAAEILKNKRKYEIQFIIEFSNSYERKLLPLKYLIEIEKHIIEDHCNYKIDHYSITHS